jgi:hypothetical protein
LRQKDVRVFVRLFARRALKAREPAFMRNHSSVCSWHIAANVDAVFIAIREPAF